MPRRVPDAGCPLTDRRSRDSPTDGPGGHPRRADRSRGVHTGRPAVVRARHGGRTVAPIPVRLRPDAAPLTRDADQGPPCAGRHRARLAGTGPPGSAPAGERPRSSAGTARRRVPRRASRIPARRASEGPRRRPSLSAGGVWRRSNARSRRDKTKPGRFPARPGRDAPAVTGRAG